MRTASFFVVLGIGCLALACGADVSNDGQDGPRPNGEVPPNGNTPPSTEPTTPIDDAPIGTFPKGFVFGTAIAGFQVDMGCPTIAAAACEDRASDWYRADVRGYFAWSLMDNYEWNHGMGMKFGLYQVHPTTKARALRDAGEAYRQMATTHDVSAELEAKYASFFVPK